MKTKNKLNSFLQRSTRKKALVLLAACALLSATQAQTIERGSSAIGDLVDYEWGTLHQNDASDIISLSETRVVTTATALTHVANITVWDVASSSAITKKAYKNTLTNVREVRMAKLSSTRFANAYISNGILELQVYDVSSDGTLTLKGSKQGDPIYGDVKVISLSSSRIVTLLADSQWDMRMNVWDISSSGTITRTGTYVLATSCATLSGTKLTSSKFATVCKNETGSKTLIRYWSVSTDGNISLLDGIDQGREPGSFDMATIASDRFVVISNGGQRDGTPGNLYSVFDISSSNDLSLVEEWNSLFSMDLAITKLTTRTILVAAQDGNTDDLNLRTYHIATDGQLSKTDEYDAGTIHQVALATLYTHTTSARAITAVVDGYDQLKLIAWDISLPSDARINEEPTVIKKSESVVSLLNAYPNPVSSNATFAFELKESSVVSLKVFNSLGELVQDVASGSFPQGAHQLNWSVDNVPAGIYYYTFESAGERLQQKIVVTH